MVLPLLVAFVIASWTRIIAYLKQLDGEDSIECNGGKEDCISGLPDDILLSILSRFSFRDAIKTSILSRRWRYLHASMPNLDFNSLTMFELPEDVHVCPQYLRKVVSGVNQFVELYSGPKINSFRFSFCFGREFAADTERWIRLAIRMGVEELDINFECNQKEFIFSYRYNFSKLPTFSYELLSASSNLKHLQLHACVVPSFNVKINSLKSLDLDGVPLAGREVEDILSCCLNLEQLRIRKCIFPAKLCIYGPSLRLKLLTINDCSGLEAINLCAINLTMFECFDDKLINFSFSRVPKLERVFLYVNQKIGMPYIFNELPTYLPQLKTLLVRTSSMQVAYIPARITLFSSLKQLDLFLTMGTQVELLKIACILSACPLLQKFCLMRKAWLCKNKNADIATEGAPPCHHMQLEEVELGGFVGTQNELTFALYFLRSAAVLKRMVISMNCTDYWGFGKYGHHTNGDAWSDKERKIIHRHLQGNALSGSAECNGGKEDCISRLPDDIKEDCISGLPDDIKEDCISGLPDDILSSILSCLSFKDAVKTSILSRRWRYLHASNPNLDFNSLTMFGLPEDVHVCPQFLQKFVRGVNQFVELYSGPNINSFRFSFCFERKFAADTERWIRFAIRMGVKELDINFECKQKYFIFSYRYNFSKLPTFSYELLSASSNLKHLQLHACVVPSFNVKINSLKSLDLDGVPLAGREVEDILSCCLNLEQLRIRKCILPAKLCICGPSLRLKLLTINYCSGLEAIDLCAINLTIFECFDGKLINFSFSRVPKLERVFLYVFQKIGMPYIFNELPRYLPQLKTLLVRTASMQVAYIPARITLFSSLKQLDLFLSLGTRVELLKIACILRACPLLQKFCLMRKGWSCKNKNADIATEEAPPCHHMQLEEVELGGFVGTQNELTFALYFLRSAAALKRMVITRNCTDYWGFGKYGHYKKDNAWSDKERKIIHQHLQGNALSGSAEVGYEMIDAFAESQGIQMDTVNSKAIIGQGFVGDAPVLLAKPQTYMNLSGESTGPLAAYYKLPLNRVVVFHDGMPLPCGVLRLQHRGGHGSHNGLKSVIYHFRGNKEFARLRIGIGRPPGQMDPTAFLLQKFNALAQERTDVALQEGVEALKLLLSKGLTESARCFNTEQKYKHIRLQTMPT